MEQLHQSGIWVGFSPDAKPGQMYKLVVYGRNGRVEHCDPFGFGMELPVDLSPEGLREAAEETVGMGWTTCLYDGSVPALAIKFDSPPDYDKNIY